ncbi:MAG: putative lipid II flippase FtsW [Candidatus Calescibacterium sp.]|nr:putative lipid II flippase FtsW [Candidatus Calescibacterium sp.]MCX7734466.1 putative lipid II flippase FtsW [bacterium]MDW8087340.1 putative peptidoglycan glycosyltransferase FtsW [Candidatus Calescibacterium sp.]
MKSSLIILSVLFLTFIGLIFILNITYIRNPADPYIYVKKQAIGVLVGLSLMFLSTQIKIELIRKISPILVLIVFVSLILTLFIGKGPGVKRWITFPGFSIQPSEFLKVVLPVFLANIALKIKQDGELDFSKTITVFLIGAIVSFPIALQPDFGNFAFCILITLFTLFIVGAKIRYLLLISSPTIAGLIFLAIISPYRLKRLLVFLDPWKDPQGSGYQIIQSMISYSSGGITGKGIGDGIQKLFFLPSSHTDFIISVIAEELGVIGIITIITALSVITIVGFTSALKMKDEFARSLAASLTFCITFQALFNLLVTVGLVPTKGLTFPFVSYGGSSVIASFLCAGLLVSVISKNQNN